ncbi:SDR family NAD(P)-dependent oxidoreductase [Gracilibacillus kekensis]|uniref:3-oxoacyl-[acyl-carrier protein] reductase n=1 Tax=Gracilibacillus kekensis TaxID=1027249 RepID=A0A1M7P2J1_9BACI|nr:SDR family oxidoreductase [Gracilibacillus kekensis]SHN10397.1 3-oxoacyl-[acyl-carrier protein] reductase [Gracilibacillus kekensis]
MSIFSKDALAYEHIVITGATGDIGFDTAKVIASMGARITINGRNEIKLENLKQELLEITNEDSIAVIAADITKAQEREKLVSKAEKRLGVITGLVNAAGISGGGTVDQLSEEEIEKIMQVNYLSTFSLTKMIYQNMIKQKKGHIVNVASLSGLRATRGNSAYASSKFALVGWTQSLAVEAIEHNIRVNAVCPGFVDSEMATQAIERKAEQNGISYEDQLEKVKQGLPSGRLTTTTEVGNTIAFLLTDATPNIVGESVKISGGSVMR